VAVIGPFTLQQLGAVAAATRARVAAASLGEITRLVVHLSPEHLGPVRISAEQTAAGVQVELAGGDETVREALRTSLDELRRELDVGSSGRQDARDPRDPREPRDAGRWATGADGDRSSGGGDHGDRSRAGTRTATPVVPGPVAPAVPVDGRLHRGVDVRA